MNKLGQNSTTSRGNSMVEYLPILAIFTAIIVIAIPSIGRRTACTFCATKYGTTSTSFLNMSIIDSAYASVGGPPPPPPSTQEYLQLCMDGFVNPKTCE